MHVRLQESFVTVSHKSQYTPYVFSFPLGGVLTFVASGLDINGCVLSYFEGTVHLHFCRSCTLTTLHCI